ncbi:MAG: adenylate/guanylate cyclase domain-containing protein [Ignavibacteriales bacterium]|nr:MAG: adenylate/guanylate cyclase domain-containing protein [Ignavibacteriales bacterium]
MNTKFSASELNKLKTVLTVSIAGIIIGILFANIAFGFTFYRVVKGALIGFLITSISSWVELFYFQKKLIRLNFSAELLLRTIFYIVLITFTTLTVVVIHESLEDEMTLSDALLGSDVADFISTDFTYIFIFAIAGSLIINFTWQISRMLGKGVLTNVILGRYRRPAIEKKVFMFLDLKSSTMLAEKLDPYSYSRLLQEFFNDITDPVINHSGQIYQYVGDEVVLMWNADDGIKNNNCVNCFRSILSNISRKQEQYLNHFAFVPEFKAGIHIGDAVVTEVGELKKEIVYHGDVLNTASRIQSECNKLGVSLLISNDVAKALNNDESIQLKSEGKILLKGKEKEVELFSVQFTGGMI